MPVVGTAGHVDHGKSTLITALTGRDPDRWEEEKRRGLTIDLGFAWMTLADGSEVSFVDVPGHERFVKNMLAGVDGIDVALLVVAADEGWMPQSEEHLAVLDLLGVSRGVVALTKIDRVDDETVELAGMEVADRLTGTTLEGSPLVPVAAVRGEGLDRLQEELGRAVAGITSEESSRPRMWVDRVFAVAGAGMVVTGTLLGGRLRVGERVMLWPGGQEGRIRGLHSHERPLEEVGPGRRVAVNLVGVDREAVERGAMLGLPGQWLPTRRVAVLLRLARYIDELTERGAFHLHLGSGSWPVRIRLVDQTGEGLVAVADLPEPLCVQMGDRFILRETGRRQVMAGGVVIDPAPQPLRRLRTLAAPLAEVARSDPHRRAAALLRVRGVEDVEVLAAHSGGGRPPAGLLAEGVAVDPARAEALGAELERRVRDFHAANPLRPGVGVAELASLLRLPQPLVSALASRHPSLRLAAGVVAAADFRVERSVEDERAWRDARRLLEEAGVAPPRLRELGLAPELVHALVRQGELVKVAEDLVYLPHQLERVLELLRSLPQPFTVSQFREQAGVSRRHAVPLLEWTDARGITLRRGDLRTLRDDPR